MVNRDEPFHNRGVYHVFNKTIDKRPIFTMENNFYADHFLKLISYYRSEKASISYSDLKRLDKTSSDALLKTTKIKKYFKVNLLIYTLMPNHFHLLIMQNQEGGIIKFYSDIINSLEYAGINIWSSNMFWLSCFCIKL